MSAKPSSSNATVFISHSHADRHTAVQLQKVLEESGAYTFLDQDTIDTLDNLPQKVQQGIGQCDFLLLLWSASAAGSAWVQREWQTAHKLGKTIIPYVLDGTPRPYLLEDLVFIPGSDAKHGHSKLLKAVGRPGVGVFAGEWEARVDAFGMVQGSYRLQLRDNGQVEGDGGISDAGWAQHIAGEMGVGNLLSMRMPVHGSWSYDRGTRFLTIDITAEAFGQQQHDTIQIQATGREQSAISGQDLAGRTWTLHRIGDRRRAPTSLEAEKQRVRDALQTLLDNASKDSPTLPVVLAAACLGAQEGSKHDLGLPTKKARRLMQADANTFAAAWRDFAQALERGKWVH